VIYVVASVFSLPGHKALFGSVHLLFVVSSFNPYVEVIGLEGWGILFSSESLIFLF